MRNTAWTPADFWDCVYPKTPGACWFWNGSKDEDGYGIIRWQGKTRVGTHRIAFQLAYPNVPMRDFVVMHTCDTPACCNPSHLQLGTQRENQLDKVRKGRQAKGERNGRAKLTDAQRVEIRQRYQFRKVTCGMLSAEYGVCPTQIRRVVRGES